MTLSKEMQEALNNPAVHNYTKMIILEAQGKDICDTLHSLEYVTHLFKKHMDDTLKGLEVILDGDKIRLANK